MTDRLREATRTLADWGDPGIPLADVAFYEHQMRDLAWSIASNEAGIDLSQYAALIAAGDPAAEPEDLAAEGPSAGSAVPRFRRLLTERQRLQAILDELDLEVAGRPEGTVEADRARLARLTLHAVDEVLAEVLSESLARSAGDTTPIPPGTQVAVEPAAPAAAAASGSRRARRGHARVGTVPEPDPEPDPGSGQALATTDGRNDTAARVERVWQALVDVGRLRNPATGPAPTFELARLGVNWRVARAIAGVRTTFTSGQDPTASPAARVAARQQAYEAQVRAAARAERETAWSSQLRELGIDPDAFAAAGLSEESGAESAVRPAASATQPGPATRPARTGSGS